MKILVDKDRSHITYVVVTGTSVPFDRWFDLHRTAWTHLTYMEGTTDWLMRRGFEKAMPDDKLYRRTKCLEVFMLKYGCPVVVLMPQKGVMTFAPHNKPF